MHDIGSGCVDEDVLQHDVDVALFVVNTHVFVCTSKVADAQQLLDQRIGLIQETLLLFLWYSNGRAHYLPVEIKQPLLRILQCGEEDFKRWNIVVGTAVTHIHKHARKTYRLSDGVD